MEDKTADFAFLACPAERSEAGFLVPPCFAKATPGERCSFLTLQLAR
jgi:hypothetical protein